MSARRFPNYEPGNATSYDLTLVRLPNESLLIALWPNLHCSACVVLPLYEDGTVEGSADYVATKLRVSEVDAEAIMAFVREEFVREEAPKL